MTNNKTENPIAEIPILLGYTINRGMWSYINETKRGKNVCLYETNNLNLFGILIIYFYLCTVLNSMYYGKIIISKYQIGTKNE